MSTAPSPFLVLAAALLLGLVAPSEAHAYLDPGTGSAVIQMVVASVMGGLFLIKTYWRKIVAFFRGEAAEVSDVGDAQSASGDERD